MIIVYQKFLGKSIKYRKYCLKNLKKYVIINYKIKKDFIQERRKQQKNNRMKVAILTAATGALEYRLLDKKLNELIETSQCFLFYILCGYVEGRKSKEKTLGERWAKNNGAPILYISEKSTERLLSRVLYQADYIIFILNGNPLINNALMQYKMMGKHGSVIRV